MLKIWKQTWKREDSARRPQDSDAQGVPLIGTSSSESSQNSAAVIPPSTSDIGLGPVLPRGRRGTTKRIRARCDADEHSVEPDLGRPHKKLKLGGNETNDTLRNHLPEVIHSAVRPQTRGATFAEELFNHAKVENSECINESGEYLPNLPMVAIALFTSAYATFKVVAQYLTWAVDRERSLAESKTPRLRKTAVLVIKSDIFSPVHCYGINGCCSDVQSIKVRVSTLQSECNLAVGMCADSASEWSNLLYNDVVLTSAEVCVTLSYLMDSQLFVADTV